MDDHGCEGVYPVPPERGMVGMLTADEEPRCRKTDSPLPAESEGTVPAPVAVDDAANLFGDFVEDQIAEDAAATEQWQVVEDDSGRPFASHAEDPVDEVVLPEPEGMRSSRSARKGCVICSWSVVRMFCFRQRGRALRRSRLIWQRGTLVLQVGVSFVFRVKLRTTLHLRRKA